MSDDGRPSPLQLDYARPRGVGESAPRERPKTNWRVFWTFVAVIVVVVVLVAVNYERENIKQRARAEAVLPSIVEAMKADPAFHDVSVSVDDVADLGPTLFFFGSVADDAAYSRLERIANHYPGIEPAFVVFVNPNVATKPK